MIEKTILFGSYGTCTWRGMWAIHEKGIGFLLECFVCFCCSDCYVSRDFMDSLEGKRKQTSEKGSSKKKKTVSLAVFFFFYTFFL